MPVRNDGARIPSEFAGQQIIFNTYNFYGTNPAMPLNNDQALSMPAAQGVNQNQQGAAQGYPRFAGHENIHGNALPPQQGQLDQLRQLAQAQKDFFARLRLPAEAQNLLRAMRDNPFAMDGLVQICLAVANDPRASAQDHIVQQQRPAQNQQSPQGQQIALERPQNQQILPSVEIASPAPQIRESFGTPSAISDDATPQNIQGDDQGQQSDVASSPRASSPSEAASPVNFGTSNSDQSLHVMEVTQQMQNRAANLIAQPATSYMGYIETDAECSMYKKAVWKAKRKENDIQDKCQGYPIDSVGKMRVKQRIFRAIHNMEGEQDPASDRGEFMDSVAVKAVKALSDLETEIIAHELMEYIRKVQCGEAVLELPAECKLVQEASFIEKLNQVVQALSFNKPLCRSATTTAEWIARIAADPVSERHKKVINNRNNKGKASVLRKDANVRGVSRGKGKKRPAPDESDSNTTRESTVEVPEVVRSTQKEA